MRSHIRAVYLCGGVRRAEAGEVGELKDACMSHTTGGSTAAHTRSLRGRQVPAQHLHKHSRMVPSSFHVVVSIYMAACCLLCHNMADGVVLAAAHCTALILARPLPRMALWIINCCQ